MTSNDDKIIIVDNQSRKEALDTLKWIKSYHRKSKSAGRPDLRDSALEDSWNKILSNYKELHETGKNKNSKE